MSIRKTFFLGPERATEVLFFIAVVEPLQGE
jgi:hypothetical protein